MDGYMEPTMELRNMDGMNAGLVYGWIEQILCHTSCEFDLNDVSITVTLCPTGLPPSFNQLGWMDRMVEQGTSG